MPASALASEYKNLGYSGAQKGYPCVILAKIKFIKVLS